MEITRKGTVYQTKGVVPTVGELAPAFALENTKGEVVTQESLKGSVVVISVIPDINTSVCDLQTKAFNQKVAALSGVRLVTISKNTKEQFLEWCGANGVEMEMLSDTEFSFGTAYGIYVPELAVDQRSVFVLDMDGTLAYKEVLVEMVNEPNYDAALEEAKELV